MPAQIIDGKALAARIREQVAAEVAEMAAGGVTPGLAVILIGQDPASEIYVRSKARLTMEVGMISFAHALAADVSEGDVLALIGALNEDHAVDGILVQMPLPPHINAEAVINAIDPEKDVDGFHPVNVGRLATSSRGLTPCTPRGALLLLKSVRENLSGLEAVVVGRSNIVGKPMVQLLINENCTVTIAHSKSRNLPDLVARGDIVIAAVGRPELIRGDWLKEGALVIDVGINRLEGAAGRTRLVGDVAFDEAAETAGALTPVPGGVGPMTIACLLRNTLDAAKTRRCGHVATPATATLRRTL